MLVDFHELGCGVDSDVGFSDVGEFVCVMNSHELPEGEVVVAGFRMFLFGCHR